MKSVLFFLFLVPVFASAQLGITAGVGAAYSQDGVWQSSLQTHVSYYLADDFGVEAQLFQTNAVQTNNRTTVGYAGAGVFGTTPLFGPNGVKARGGLTVGSYFEGTGAALGLGMSLGFIKSFGNVDFGVNCTGVNPFSQGFDAVVSNTLILGVRL